MKLWLFAMASTAFAQMGASPGSIYIPGSRLADLTRDLRASQLNDIVTILVADRASAISKGATNTSRKSSARGSVTSLAGKLSVAGPLANLGNLGGEQQLEGQGLTSRESTLTTTISARVVQVLANGNLVIEGAKDISVNSERQWVTVRGMVRPTDLSTGNVVSSDRVANLEIRVNGKGVVGDSIKRPFILYRILLGLLPF